jgi:predicted nucleotidyltransferase
VLSALREAKLEAIVVGNVAAILQGAPVTTQDLDLLVRDTPLNRKKISLLGRALGATPRLISELSVTMRIDARAGTVDILFDEISGGLKFQRLRARAARINIGGHRARVALLEDVIASKRAANRPKDRAVLPMLEDVLRIKTTLAKVTPKE